MIAWGETMVKGRKDVNCMAVSSSSICKDTVAIDHGEPSLNIQGLDIISGYPNLELAGVLFETQGAASRLLNQGGYQQGIAMQLDSRLKGFSL